MTDAKKKLVAPLEAISPAEAAELDQQEATIVTGRGGIRAGTITVGGALKAIRDKRLYRAEYFSFRLYVMTRWQMSQRQADRMIAAYDVVQNMVDKSEDCETRGSHLPEERQARILARLPAEDQAAAWEEAKKLAERDGNHRVSSRYVEAVVNGILNGEEPVVEPLELPERIQQENDADERIAWAIRTLTGIDRNHPGKSFGYEKLIRWIFCDDVYDRKREVLEYARAVIDEQLRVLDSEAVEEVTR